MVDCNSLRATTQNVCGMAPQVSGSTHTFLVVRRMADYKIVHSCTCVIFAVPVVTRQFT